MNDSPEMKKIFSLVSKKLNTPMIQIRDKYDRKALLARGFICHLIFYGFGHLRRAYMAKMNVSKTAFYKNVNYASDILNRNLIVLRTMNDIRGILDLPALEEPEHLVPSISNTRRLFGFDYTDEDIIRRGKAIHGANLYMTKICSIGRQPVEEGMVFSLKSKPNTRKWYHDNV